MKTNKFFELILKLTILSLFFFIIRILASSVISIFFENPKALDTATSMIITLFLFFISSLLVNLSLFPIILKSKFRGINLYISVALIYLIINSGLNFIEAFFFNESVNIPITIAIMEICTDIISALIYFPIAVFILGKMKKENIKELYPSIKPGIKSIPLLKILLLAFLIYPFIYMLFGNLAILFKAVKEYYSAIAQNSSEFSILKLYFLQCFRGLIWICIAIIIMIQYHAKWMETALIVGLCFALVMINSLLIPNSYMPFPVRIVHFFELLFSNFIWGFLIVFLLKKRES